MLFAGNTSFADSTPTANSLYVRTNAAANTITFNAVAATSTIDLVDPLLGLSQTGGSLSLVKTGAGTLKMAGANAASTSGGAAPIFAVNQGTLYLYRAGETTSAATSAIVGSLNLGTTGSSFSVANGARLNLGGGNTITAGSVTMNTGSTLGFDLANLGAQTALTVTSGTDPNLVTGTNLNFGVDLTTFSAVDSTYILVDSQTAGKFSGVDLAASSNAVTLNGVAVNTALDRADVDLGWADNGKQLVITTTLKSNEVLTWTGKTDAEWAAGTVNWKDTFPRDHYFLDGDVVNFDSTDKTNNRDITIVGHASVGDMTVSGTGTYTFSGGNLSSAASSKGLITTKKLLIQTTGPTGGAVFKNAVNFAGGMQIATGARATLADGGSFDAAMAINNAGTLTFDRSAGNDYTYDGIISGVTGVVEKTGDGAFTLNSVNTGTFFQQAGDVHLKANWGGTYNHNAGSLYADDNVHIQNNLTVKGTLDIGSNLTNAPGTLTVGGDLTLDGATVNIDLFDANASDTITVVTGTAAFTPGVGISTINLSHWAVGVFTIISATGGVGTVDSTTFRSVQLGNIDIDASTRMNAALSQSGNSVILTTSMLNKDLTWKTDSGLWKYDSSLTHWFQNDAPSVDDYFHAQDTVYFTGDHSGTVTVDSAGIQVADMYVTGGEYLFTGGQILGQAVNVSGYVRTGKLTVEGPGTQAYFNNAASFAGNILVDNQATLGGVGTLAGNVTVSNGGVLSPGYHGLDTLTVNGNVTFGAGTFFDVEVNPDDESRSDLLAVIGDVNLSGATVRHTGLNNAGGYDPRGVWTIMTYTGTRTGQFADLESDFAFLTAKDIYDDVGKKVQLELDWNGTHFNSFAHTFNQHQVANGLMSIGNSPLFNSILALPNGSDFAGIYNQLSGEINADVIGGAFALMRDFSPYNLRRLSVQSVTHNPFFQPQAEAASGLALGSLAECLPESWGGVWAEGGGSYSRIDDTGNASSSRMSGPEFSLGYDRRLAGGMLGGIGFRYSDKNFELRRGSDKTDINSYSVFVHGGKEIEFWNGISRLMVGGSYTYHDFSSSRGVAFLGERLKADYHGHSYQVFTEASHAIAATRSLIVEPYVGFSYDALHTPAYSERGGAARLRVRSRTFDGCSSYLGTRFHILAHERVDLNADVAWMHTYGNTTPETVSAFVGSDNFRVRGTSISRNALVVGVGMEAKLTERLSLNVNYRGVMGDKDRSHGGSVGLALKW